MAALHWHQGLGWESGAEGREEVPDLPEHSAEAKVTEEEEPQVLHTLREPSLSPGGPGTGTWGSRVPGLEQGPVWPPVKEAVTEEQSAGSLAVSWQQQISKASANSAGGAGPAWGRRGHRTWWRADSTSPGSPRRRQRKFCAAGPSLSQEILCHFRRSPPAPPAREPLSEELDQVVENSERADELEKETIEVQDPAAVPARPSRTVVRCSGGAVCGLSPDPGTAAKPMAWVNACMHECPVVEICVSEESGLDSESASNSLRFSKACLKNVFSVLLIFIYLLLMAVAVFLVYQTITDFREKLKHPVMSVSYKEVDRYDAPGIALYPGQAQLLSCKHHYEVVPPLPRPGQPGDMDCTTQRINYTHPFSNQTVGSWWLHEGFPDAKEGKVFLCRSSAGVTLRSLCSPASEHTRLLGGEKCRANGPLKSALVVQGPQEVKKRELVFLQFRLNGSNEDFSAIDYLLFSSFQEFLHSPDKAGFMQACESAYSSWKFSGGFRTWVKMSLVKTKEEDGREAVEFRQETSVVNYNDQRPVAEKSAQLFFVVFEWKDPFIQKVQDIITANPWNTIALLCGAFLALFKASEFAKLSVKWMIKIRKRHLKRRGQATNHIS
ncbi:Transmembrane protein 206 [Heterocephalus glaber]|uniref:Proton-activated chloride channel n=1 Tax=Heterocephalus glaber TaxID=10181 RepID=G5B605_HETGA|nr:Transmembrane protein 206 [Heterocephalus glaber]